jgi:hypothetical protein
MDPEASFSVLLVPTTLADSVLAGASVDRALVQLPARPGNRVGADCQVFVGDHERRDAMSLEVVLPGVVLPRDERHQAVAANTSCERAAVSPSIAESCGTTSANWSHISFEPNTPLDVVPSWRSRRK